MSKVEFNRKILELEGQCIINESDLKASSLVDYNVDKVKLIPYIIEAQKLNLEPLIGTALVRALQDPDRPWEYDRLAKSYVYDCILHWALASYLQVAPYSVANGGVFKHLPEDAETVFDSEVQRMVQRERFKAQEFSDRLIKFLDNYRSNFPEYTKCISDGIKAKRMVDFTAGWVFGSGADCGTTCPPVEDFFTASFYWGYNNTSTMGFDPETLENVLQTIPNEASVQPQSQYIWFVSSEDFSISQGGLPVPLGSFPSADADDETFVKGTQGGMTWIRSNIQDTYEQLTTYQINV